MISNYLTANNRTVSISVKELINWVFLSGNLSSGVRDTSRSSEGITIHRRIQRSHKKTDGYQSEYALNYQTEFHSYHFNINGRIDGVYQNSDPPLIEEIKTTGLDLSSVEQYSNDHHWNQVKCYAYLYASINDLPEVNVQLLYFNIHNLQEKTISQNYDYKTLKAFFLNILLQFVKWIDFEVQRQEVRNQSIKQLNFPFEKLRHGQDDMINGIEQAIDAERNIFIRAPTGIGKTAATIFPALKSMCSGKVEKIFYLTAKTLTREIVISTLNRMKDKGLHIIALIITAKEKICPQKADKCDQDSCPYAIGYYDRLGEAIWDILHHHTIIDRVIITQYARKYQLCPFEFSLDIALWADLVVGDYNYFFDPRVYLKRFLYLKKMPFILLVDEAHNLVSRAREMYSEKIQLSQFRKIAKKINYKQINDKIREIIERFEYLSKMTEGYHYLVQIEPFSQLLQQLKDISGYLEQWLANNEHHPHHHEILDFYFNIVFYVKVSEYYDLNYSSYLEINKSDMVVKQFCMDPSKMIRETICRVRSAVFFSATLQPLDYYQQLLGGNELDHSLNLPSPFNPLNQKIISTSYIDTTYRKRHLSFRQVAEIIQTSIQGKTGNYMVYFPSYRYLDSVHQFFVSCFPQVNTVVQKPAMSELAREKFLLNFQTGQNASLLGFAVMGGVFSESIDLIGDKLIGVIIVGVGLPQICLELNILKSYFEENYSRGFEYAYIIPGANKVMQAGGRVIRSDKDRGIIILVDSRYNQSIYDQILPDEWSHRISVDNLSQLKIILDEFWH
ncbi:MAG: hypothetical protein APR63_09690 [Desulfuromonas sp. SDB]|nr:MAG: hypothetical protein APR63_09690 [Desulfuromonas sp. SDB]